MTRSGYWNGEFQLEWSEKDYEGDLIAVIVGSDGGIERGAAGDALGRGGHIGRLPLRSVGRRDIRNRLPGNQHHRLR